MTHPFKLWKVTLLLLLGLFVFLYLFVNTAAEFYVAVTNPAAGLHFHFNDELRRVVIYDVVAEGPADVAGLQKGDQILEVNNQPISKLSDFVRALLNLEIGKLAEIKALRNNQEVRIAFVSERWLNTKLIFWSLMPGILFSYTLCLIGTFVLLKRIQDREAHIFYLMLIFWALAMRDIFTQSYFLHNILPFWFREILLVPVWPLAVGLLLHFHLIFPIENKLFQKHPKLFMVIIYAPLILLVPHFYGVFNELQWVARFLQIGWGIWLSIYFVIALFLLRHSLKHAPNPHIKKQTEIILYGTTLSLGLPFLLYFLPKLLITRSFPYAEFCGILVILWPITLAYTIVKHRFMDIDFIVKRGVAYALMSGFVVAAYFLLVVGVGKLVLYLTGSTSQLVIIFATLFIAALFNPVKNRVQNFVDHRFYPSKFTYREAIRSFGHQLVNVLDLQRLLQMLSSFLTETMKIRPVVIYWLDHDVKKYKVGSMAGLQLDHWPIFTSEDKVIRKLQIKQKLVDLSSFINQPDHTFDAERKKWGQLKAEMALPLLSKTNLVGLLSLGPKQEEEPYFKEDLELLQSLSDRINISLDNALLTEDLREQDRLKKELEVARRIQLSSLPQSDPHVPGLDISGVSIPAMEVGGDYYDYIDFADGRFGVVVGDVSGKGTSAALYMSQLKGILKTASKYKQSLIDLMAEVNAITFNSIELQSFITLTCGAFDLKRRKFSLVRAGHLPLIYYSAKHKTCQELVPKGMGIGLEDGKLFKSELEEVVIEFNSGDLFLFFSDGIIEARNSAGEEFELQLLVKLLSENGWNSSISLREKIIAKVQEFSGITSQKDDMTLVVVKVV